MNVQAQAAESIAHELQLALVLRLRFLTQTPGRGIARIGERFLAHRCLAGVEVIELGGSKEHLAANFDDGRVSRPGEFLRNGRNESNVFRHVLAGGAITAGRRLDEHPVFITHAESQSVDLELAQPPHWSTRIAFGLGHPFGQLVEGKNVVQAVQPFEVHDGGEQGGAGRAAHLLSGAILALHLREFAFDAVQPGHEFVVLRVRDQRLVAPVIGARVFADAVA